MAITLNGTTGITTPTETASTSVTTPLLTSPASTALTIQSAGTTAMTIGTSQLVGIGTTSPQQKFVVSNAGAEGLEIIPAPNASESRIQSYNRSGAAYNRLSTISSDFVVYTNGGATTGMIVNSSGQVQIGTSTIGGQLTVWFPGASTFGIGINNTDTGSAGQTSIAFQRNGSYVGTINTTNTATSYNTSSDYRLKKNVEPMTDGLAVVSSLKPVKYNWKIDGSSGEGFLAHELQAIVPLAVSGDKDAVDDAGNPLYQSVDYSKIVVHLVAAVQELSAQVAALQKGE